MALYSSKTSIAPPNKAWAQQQLLNQQNVFSAQTYPGSGVSGGPAYNPPQLFEGEGHNAEIEKRLRSLIPDKPIITDFVSASADDVIQVLGDTDPMFGRSLTSLAEALLSCAPDPRSGYHYQLTWTGLFFQMPKVFAMPDRIGTSYVGLALLDHWAAKDKRFAPYVDAYIDEEVRKRIAADCFAFGMGHMPKWIKDAIAHGEKLRRRWEQKEAQRQAVEMERRRQEEMARQSYYNQINQQVIQQQLQPIWTTGTGISTPPAIGTGISMTNLAQSIANSSLPPSQKGSLLQQLTGGLFKNGN